jgi:beta-glucanase (GH16 family)
LSSKTVEAGGFQVCFASGNASGTQALFSLIRKIQTGCISNITMRYLNLERLLPVAAICFLASGCAGSFSSDTASVEAPLHSWELIWGDEFDAVHVDSAKWEYALDCSDHGNNEAQCYTDRRSNSFIDSEGIFHIVAKEENFSGPAHSQGHPEYDRNDTSKTKSFTSARLRTKNLFEFKYGRVEIRAKLVGGQGMWPALWMLSTDEVYGGWPSSGEIDIMEAVNLDIPGKANQVHGSMNYGMKWPQWSATGKNYISDKSFTQEFHNFTLEWEADEIRWFIDGEHYETQTSSGWYNYIWGSQQTGFIVANPRAPFDQRFHLLMNLVVGGNWPGQPNKGWSSDREMLIDYVRVYQCGAGNVDGSGCASAADVRIDPSIEITADAGAPLVKRFPLFQDALSTVEYPSGNEAVISKLMVGSDVNTSENVVITTPTVDTSYGKALGIDFIGPGNVFIASAEAGNVDGVETSFELVGGSSWENYGTLEFDLLTDSIDVTTELFVRLDSVDPNQKRYKIQLPPVGVWQSVVIRISDLLPNPVDQQRLLKLAVIEASGPANIKVADIFLSCAVNELPKNWQWDTDCGLKPVPRTD